MKPQENTIDKRLFRRVRRVAFTQRYTVSADPERLGTNAFNASWFLCYNRLNAEV
jgi:hypothetical protein